MVHLDYYSVFENDSRTGYSETENELEPFIFSVLNVLHVMDVRNAILDIRFFPLCIYRHNAHEFVFFKASNAICFHIKFHKFTATVQSTFFFLF